MSCEDHHQSISVTHNIALDIVEDEILLTSHSNSLRLKRLFVQLNKEITKASNSR